MSERVDKSDPDDIDRRLERRARRARARRARRLHAAARVFVGLLLGVAATLAVVRASERPSEARQSPSPARTPESSPETQADSSPERTTTPSAASTEPTTTNRPATRPVAERPKKSGVANVQRLSLSIGPVGYEPSTVRASSSSPIALTVGKGDGCAAGFLIPGLGIVADNSSGPVTLKLGKVESGSYTFTCGMEMVSGTLIVN